MIKKILSLLILTIMFLPTPFCHAINVYKKIDVDQMQYPTYLDFYPRTLIVDQGDKLHLTIKAPRETDIRLFIPSFNFSREIKKNNEATVDLDIINPTGKIIWFTISGTDSKKVTGYIVVDNFNSKKINYEASSRLNTEELTNIINYDNSYSYERKDEPNYSSNTENAVPATVTPSRAVRGFW